MDKTVYRVTWWPTEDAPESMKITTKRRTQDVVITPEYETTFEDIRKIVAVYRSGNADNARFVHVFAAVQIEGAM
jgi:hypothetical protein